jgi:branched-subunit amino acid aminotransferase/4-amino-4-deoxychorismate lyase|tara:strand:+ start:343 stop:555 length:213 start_codon:yes stop_codon:yes gene_type:complete
MFEVYVSGHEVAILVDENQKIHGGPGLNIFSLEGGVLHTPEIGVLKGVTRRYFKVFQKSSVLLLNYNLCL